MNIRSLHKHYLILLLAFLSFAVQSCWPINKIRAKADQCCNFLPATNKLSFKCGKDSIIFIRISFAGKTFYEAGYSPPVNEIIIPTIPDSIRASREIGIDIWNFNQTIQDYSITVTPKDWQSGKPIYSHYSYR